MPSPLARAEIRRGAPSSNLPGAAAALETRAFTLARVSSRSSSHMPLFFMPSLYFPPVFQERLQDAWYVALKSCLAGPRWVVFPSVYCRWVAADTDGAAGPALRDTLAHRGAWTSTFVARCDGCTRHTHLPSVAIRPHYGSRRYVFASWLAAPTAKGVAVSFRISRDGAD